MSNTNKHTFGDFGKPKQGEYNPTGQDLQKATSQNLKKYETSENLAEVKVKYSNKVKASDRIKVNSSRDADAVLRRAFNTDTMEYQEEFIILLLNRANKVLGWVKISSGGISSTVCDGKVIFAIALQTGASAVILSHNHPSGNLKASQADIALTKNLKKMGEIMEIPILDHVILTDEGYVSLADDGLM